MSKTSDNTQIALDAIGHALADKQLQVPVYQRPYAWEESHVSEFLRDISDALAANESEYFLGSIVCTKSDRTLEVVDGQQRLATTSILIAAIRDYFLRRGDVNRANDLESTYLLKRDLRSQETRPKLRLSDSDNDYWIRTILDCPSTESTQLKASSRSHKRIAKAARLAAKHVQHLVETTQKPVDALSALIEYLSESVRVIWIQVHDDANAFVIFETLNDRGMDLALSDLLKNYLFLLSAERIGETQRSWVAATASLEAVDDDSVVTDFIRYYWSSRVGATRERELYTSLKRGIVDKASAVAFAADLASSARLYAALVNSDSDIWKKYGTETRSHVRTINLLGMKQVRPLLLAVLEYFSPAQVRQTLRSVVSWGVRLLIGGGLGGGVMEGHYCEAAREVRSRQVRTSAELKKLLKKVIPNDTDFRASFSNARVSKSPLARYYLSVLERESRGEKNPELVPNQDEGQVNLEHVLPKTPEGNWPNFTEEEAWTWHKRLGNLALMKSDENSAEGNETFATKKKAYSKSRFDLTRSIGQAPEWTTAAIEERQQTLSALAVKAWRL